MDNIVGPIEQLIRNLTRLPGIGPKTAQRLAYHIIDMDKVEVEELANSIGTILINRLNKHCLFRKLQLKMKNF